MDLKKSIDYQGLGGKNRIWIWIVVGLVGLVLGLGMYLYKQKGTCLGPCLPHCRSDTKVFAFGLLIGGLAGLLWFMRRK